MSDTGTSTGDLDDERDEAAATAKSERDTTFVQVAAGVPITGPVDGAGIEDGPVD